MGYFPVRYNSRVVIYEHKMFIRFATGYFLLQLLDCMLGTCMLLAGMRVHERW